MSLPLNTNINAKNFCISTYVLDGKKLFITFGIAVVFWNFESLNYTRTLFLLNSEKMRKGKIFFVEFERFWSQEKWNFQIKNFFFFSRVEYTTISTLNSAMSTNYRQHMLNKFSFGVTRQRFWSKSLFQGCSWWYVGKEKIFQQIFHIFKILLLDFILHLSKIKNSEILNQFYFLLIMNIHSQQIFHFLIIMDFQCMFLSSKVLKNEAKAFCERVKVPASFSFSIDLALSHIHKILWSSEFQKISRSVSRNFCDSRRAFAFWDLVFRVWTTVFT